MADSTLNGRHAIITGGGRGIGAAVARRLAADGASITLLGRDMAALRATADSLPAGAAVVHCDVTSESSVASAFEDARAGGVPYILVNNAGQAAGAAFTDTTLELWQQLFAVNVTGTFLCSRQVVEPMVAAGGGRIVNIASVAGLHGAARIAAYSASKHAVVGLTRSLGVELAKSGVTVNAVCPTYTDTDMTARTIAAVADRLQTSPGEALKRITRTIPLGRLITPEEVADAVSWLCSPGAAAITAQCITVAGGEVQ